MGNDQKEKVLRQVNIDTESVSAVSEYMNTRTTDLKQWEKQDEVNSPVMKELENITEITANEPTEKQVIEAHEDVGMKLATNSKKHPKRVSRAKEKWQTQKDLIASRKTFDDAESKKPVLTKQELEKNQEDSYAKLQQPDVLKKFMFEKTGKRGDEKLIKNHDKIWGFMSLVSDFEAVVNRKKEKKNPTEKDKKELVSAEARLKTLYDMRAYYEINEKLMKNRYYGLLPRDEMYGLSFEELRFRLAQLYEKEADKRNEALIDFYQNLIRLKEIGLSDAESVTLREQEYLGVISKEEKQEEEKNPQKEMEEMSSLYTDMLSHINDDAFLTAKDRMCYKQRFFKVYSDRIIKYKDKADVTKKKLPDFMTDYEDYMHDRFKAEDEQYKSLKDKLPADEGILQKAGEEEGVIKYTEAQINGVKAIQEYLMRRAIKKDKYSFVNRILDTDFKQQLLIFYLVENEKEESAVGQDSFTAIYNYTPDFAKFEKKSSWKKISRAVRTSNSLFPTTQVLELAEKNIGEVSTRIEKDKEDEKNKIIEGARKVEDKVKDVVSAITSKGALLRVLYKMAGLHEDMPPDMAQDPVLRQRLFKEYREIADLVLRLRDLKGTDKIAKEDYGNKGSLNNAEGKEDDGEAVFDKSSMVVDKINEYVFADTKGIVGGIIGSLGGLVKGMTDTNVFSYITSGTGGIAALFGFVGAVMTATNIAVDRTLSTADRWGQSLSVSADFIDATGATLSAISTFGAIFSSAEGTVTEGKWLLDVVETATTTTTAMDKVAIAGGAFAIGAGAVKMVAGSVKLGRAISSHLDISKSKDALAEKEKTNGGLSEEDKKLQKFLSHQKFETIRQDVSAGVEIAAGALAVVAGGLAMSVHLAPIGAIVGLAALGLEITAKFISWRAKKTHWKNRVDELLGVDAMVEDVLKNHPNKEALKKQGKSNIRERMRKEALAMVGFSSYEECFRSICTEYAELLYNKVFIEKPADREMYLDAMKSLGLKYKEPKVQGEAPKPTISAMVAKMMG